MKTVEGVNIVVKGIVFLHNFEAFQKYILNIKAKILKLDQSIAEFHEDKELKRLKRGLKTHLSWVKKDYRRYKEFGSATGFLITFASAPHISQTYVLSLITILFNLGYFTLLEI